MTKNLIVNIDIKAARDMLNVAGFLKVANDGTDEEVFQAVMNRIACYGATYQVLLNESLPSGPQPGSSKDSG